MIRFLKLDFNNRLFSKPYPCLWVGLLLIIALLNTEFNQRKGSLTINHLYSPFYSQEYAKIYLETPLPMIWSFKVNDNYERQLSIFSTSWDTLITTPPGNPILYSFWRDADAGRNQITNLSNTTTEPMEISIFSPVNSADTTIITSGSAQLKQYQSIEYFGKNFTTVRFTSNGNQSELIYCFFGLGSPVPIALNTSLENIPPSIEKIKNVIIVESNKYQIRKRWGPIRIFVIYLPIVNNSKVKVDFFPG